MTSSPKIKINGFSKTIIDNGIVDDTKWKLFSNNGIHFDGIILDPKKHTIRDFKLNDIEKLFAKQFQNISNKKSRKRSIKNKNKNKKSKSRSKTMKNRNN